MLVGIIGNSNLRKAAFISGKTEKQVTEFYRKIGETLAELNAEIILVPEGAFLELVKAYKESKGRKAIGLIPKKDKIWGYEHLEPGMRLVDEEFDCSDWFNQPFQLIKKSDVILCVSLGTGCFKELADLKYCYNFLKMSKKLIVFTNLLREGKLPIEIEYDLRSLIKYVKSVEEIAAELC